jgi:hypothetical protein
MLIVAKVDVPGLQNLFDEADQIAAILASSVASLGSSDEEAGDV